MCIVVETFTVLFIYCIWEPAAIIGQAIVFGQLVCIMLLVSCIYDMVWEIADNMPAE